MDLDVLFLGTAGSAPSARRGLPATVVRRGGDRLLFDCGEGTQRQLLRSVGLFDVEDVFITHFHADHVLGLPGMLKTFDLRGRDVPIAIHGPVGTERLMRHVFQPLVGRLGYPLHVVELDPHDEVERDGYRVAAFPTTHRGGRSLGYALIEEDRPGRFDEARARELGVTPGPDYGRLQRGEAVSGTSGEVRPEQVVGEPRRGRRVVLTGDCVPSDMTAAVAHRADLLVHEASFLEEDAARARETQHSTARGAAEIAARAEVALLALTHVTQRYGGGEIRDEARAAFAATIVPRDFDRVEIPFPERGEPLHVRAQDWLGRAAPAAEPA